MWLTYRRLEELLKTVPPYRGTKDRFPVYSRKHRTKNFYVREEDGQTVFDVTYGSRYDTKPITDEEYLALPPKMRANLCIEVEGRRLIYTLSPNRMVTVRPGNDGDGELEFNAKHYGQGDMYFLGHGFAGCFSSMSRRGGMVYVVRKGGKRVWYPIYEGMKVNARTMEPSTPHEVVINHVDRKKSKKLVEKYDHFFKVSEVMLKSLTLGQVIELAASMLESEPERSSAEFAKKYASCINDAPLDAFVWFCMLNDIGRIKWYAMNAGYRNIAGPHSLQVSAHEALFMSVKRKIVKDIYTANPDTFKQVKFACGEEYPSCDWGVKVLVNGQEMEQYK